jgi:hypothetical protein
MEGQGGGEAQGVADPKKFFYQKYSASSREQMYDTFFAAEYGWTWTSRENKFVRAPQHDLHSPAFLSYPFDDVPTHVCRYICALCGSLVTFLLFLTFFDGKIFLKCYETINFQRL